VGHLTTPRDRYVSYPECPTFSLSNAVSLLSLRTSHVEPFLYLIAAFVPGLNRKRNWKMSKRELSGVSIAMGLAAALVLDAGGQTDHKLSSRLESVDFEGAAKLADS
jgi:hypothetical protein